MRPNHILEFELHSLVNEEDKDILKNHLDLINSLNEKGLKDIYKKRIKENNAATVNAGIGLISIRIKTGTLIAYEFKKNKNEHSVLLKIVLNLNNE